MKRSEAEGEHASNSNWDHITLHDALLGGKSPAAVSNEERGLRTDHPEFANPMKDNARCVRWFLAGRRAGLLAVNRHHVVLVERGSERDREMNMISDSS